MPAVESTMLALATPAPDFHLPDSVSGATISLASFAGKTGLLVMFLCPHCPFVKHIQGAVAAMARDYAGASLGIVAISPNDVPQYPEDGPEGLRRSAAELGFDFPYCYDESQETAKAYTAACTPDFFLFDADRRLVYRGQFDSSRPNSAVPVTGQDLRTAIDRLLAGQAVDEAQRPSIGCNIKWKPGNAPAYAL